MEDRQQPGGSSQLTSSQIQASIDQISHLQRILVGDDNLTLDELLAATAANDSAQGMPPGGLSEALPALLGPLLPLGIGGQAQTNGTDSFNLGSLTQKQTHLLLARRAAFVPQQYLAMARRSSSARQRAKAVQAKPLYLGNSYRGVSKSHNQIPAHVYEKRCCRTASDGGSAKLRWERYCA